ncbi:protein Ycf2-like [Cucumis melo var. makuwa]|uniref:Protein Ycf2-like n=1 Tax=Cucumis melo var. makuwa TaxID=1194695 RepID=A0A5A7TGF0_CUCMM|nr:protein Ycf2-like [Cucumis melo var. makuwa]
MGEGSGSKRESPGTTKKRVRTETKKDEANVQKKQRIKSLVKFRGREFIEGKVKEKKQKEIKGKEDTESKSEKEEKVQEDEQDEDKEDEEKQYEEGEGETVVGEDSNSSTSEIPTDTK